MKNIEKRVQELKNQKIVSIDAETNGLWGKAFAVAAVAYENGCEIDRFVARCPIERDVNEWVRDNVLSKMSNIPETHESYKEMLCAFQSFLEKHKNGKVLSHMGHIVEAGLFRDMHTLGIIGDFEAPYEWYDVCILFSDSVDNYNRENKIEIEAFDGGTHNPVYDCVSAYKAFEHMIN